MNFFILDTNDSHRSRPEANTSAFTENEELCLAAGPCALTQ